MSDQSFLSGANAPFIGELYELFLRDPAQVDESWRAYFADLHDDVGLVRSDVHGPSWADRGTRVIGGIGESADGSGPIVDDTPAATADPMLGNDIRQASLDSLRAIMLIGAYRIRGHLKARLDPLGLEPPTPAP